MKEDKLSKRLLKIASMVEKLNPNIVSDIGCDHGLLSCYLISNNICKHVYASDNKIKPLNSCISNIYKKKLQNSITTQLFDGINIENKSDVYIVAGMGVNTFLNMFKRIEHTINKNCIFVVQVNKQTKLLRKYINTRYEIIDEDVVFDEFYYEIVAFKLDSKQTLTDLEIEFGPINIKNKSENFINYLQFLRSKYLSINSISNNKFQRLIEQINYLLK